MSQAQRYANYAITAFNTANYLKTLINVERKYHSVTISQNPDNSTGAVTYLSGLTQGDTASNRDGNKVRVRSIQYHGRISINPSATQTNVRVLLCRLKDTNGTDASITDLFETPSVYEFYKTNEIFNYKVLKDKTFTVNSDKPNVVFRWFIKQNSHLQYSGNSNAVTDQQRNGYFLISISDQMTNTPTVGGRTRMQYIDN